MTRGFTVVAAASGDVVVDPDVRVLEDADLMDVVTVSTDQIVIDGLAPVRCG